MRLDPLQIPDGRCRLLPLPQHGGACRKTSDDRLPESYVGSERSSEFLMVGIGSGFKPRLDQHLLVGSLGEGRECCVCNLIDDRPQGYGRWRGGKDTVSIN